MNKPILIAAVSAALVGGAWAAYSGWNRGPQAEVISSTPVLEPRPILAEVLTVTAVSEQRLQPQEVCEEKVVQGRRPERFGDKDGMVAGAIIGGLLGNQVGGGSGRKAATVAGVVGGALAGREIDQRHTGGQPYSAVQTQCHTVDRPKDVVVGYDVQYRLDGEIGQLRVPQKPEGPQVEVGREDIVVGYDVVWRLGERSGRVRMEQQPGKTLPVEDLLPAESDPQVSGG